MGTELAVLNNEQALATGGIGLGSSLFKLKPSTLEIVQRTSQQEGAEPGRFRDTATGTHYDTMEWVLLITPVLQRAYYPKGAELGRDSKLCFSLDNVSPSKYAKEPQAPFCANCPKGSWATYRTTKSSKDVPPCKEYYHLVLADRATQMPYYFNVKGLSIAPFKQGMENLARMFAQIEYNVKAENKQIALANAEPGAEQKPLKPRPNLFDIKFPVSVTSVKTPSGLSYPLVVGKPTYMNEDARKEFGNLYLDFANRRAQGNVQSAEESEATAEDIVSEEPARSEVAAVVGPITGTVLPKSDITI